MKSANLSAGKLILYFSRDTPRPEKHTTKSWVRSEEAKVQIKVCNQ